jgi:hypothetical protein
LKRHFRARHLHSPHLRHDSSKNTLRIKDDDSTKSEMRTAASVSWS